MPVLAIISLGVMAPGLSKTALSPEEKSIIVDSIPISQSPPSSTIKSMMPANSSRTSAALVGETFPKRLAEGATRPPLNLRNSSFAIGCAGTRIATVSCPPVRAFKTLLSFLNTIVRGPGQN